MPAGWFIVLAAVVLLRANWSQDLFIASGVGVEILGLVLFALSHSLAQRGNE